MHVVVCVTVAELQVELPLTVTHAQPAEEQSAYCVSSEQEQRDVAVNLTLLAVAAAKRIANMMIYVFIVKLMKFKNLNQDLKGDG